MRAQRLLIDFVDLLEKHVYNAYEGSVSLPPPAKAPPPCWPPPPEPPVERVHGLHAGKQSVLLCTSQFTLARKQL